MYIVTFRNAPATIEKLYKVENKTPHWQNPQDVLNGFIVARTPAKAKEQYVYWFGFTWEERPKGVELNKIEIMRNA